MDVLVAEQLAHAVDVLRRCSTHAGLLASGRAHGHHQIWTRDAMIALLGASLLDDEPIRDALSQSLAMIRERQTRTGEIPNNVDPDSGYTNFRAYADSGLWFVIGSSILEPDPDAITATLHWYECQDVDHVYMVSIQESSDWQDLFATRGKGLYVNCLYAMALNKAASVVPGDWRDRAARVREAINRLLWYNGDGEMTRRFAHTFSTTSQDTDSLGRKRILPPKHILQDAHYYLPYITFRQIGEWFDTLGNLLAIISGIADPVQARAILAFIEANGIAARPAQAIYPPIEPGGPDWRDYYVPLNNPGQYHNGGSWPFIGGFYVAALVKMGMEEEARAALLRLAELNAAGEFNEWHHGVTGEPLGVADQAWSAGMYIYACECVRRGDVPYFS